MEQTIRTLEDARAVGVLSRLARARVHAGESQEQWSQEAAAALESELQAAGGASSVTAGELAREALLLLAEDAENHPGIRALIEGPEAEQLGVGTTITLVTAALVVLQTRIKFQWKDDKLSLEILKPGLDKGRLVSLAQKLLTYARVVG